MSQQTPLSLIFNSASSSRLQQRGSLVALSKALKDGSVGAQGFLDCLDVLLPSRPCAEVENSLEFAARAVFLKEGHFLGAALKVSGGWVAPPLRGLLLPTPLTAAPPSHPPPCSTSWSA